MTTIFLHGFWGAPVDWTNVLQRLPLSAGTWCPDLYRDEGLLPDVEPLAWADRFVHRVKAHCGGEPAQVVAYSMGGRLALHALLRVPGLFGRALILSANPILNQNEVSARAKFDAAWAERFRQEAWPGLARAWNAQPVLNHSAPLEHRCDDELRPLLAQSLENWSPRKHAFDAVALGKLSARVDWAFGALDQKYVGVAKDLRERALGGQISIIPEAGHRLPQDAPDFIARWVSEEN